MSLSHVKTQRDVYISYSSVLYNLYPAKHLAVDQKRGHKNVARANTSPIPFSINNYTICWYALILCSTRDRRIMRLYCWILKELSTGLECSLYSP